MDMDRRGRAFWEVMSSSLGEDFRFPVLEVFVVLFVLGTFVLVNISGIGDQFVTSESAVAFGLVHSMAGMPVFVISLLILKSVALGLGNDLDKGLIQTYFSYPIGRKSFLVARVISSLVLVLVLFTGIQIMSFYLMAPEVVERYPGTILLSYAALLGYPILVGALALIVTLLLRRGTLALISGLLIYFASTLLTPISMFVAMGSDSSIPLKALAVFTPSLALQRHYSGGFPEGLWAPSLAECHLYVMACYAMVAGILILAFSFFEKRFQL
jgi:hypothetical protein